MFKNVPDWLTEKVRGLNEDGNLDRASRGQVYYAASGWTIAWYLRTDIQSDGVDVFFKPPGDEPVDESDSLWHVHVNRATLVAETLFLLRNAPGFSELRKRMEKRDLRASYYELLAAKQFLINGFEIDARPPTGERGEDFDFMAVHDAGKVNVEVTALEAKEFSEKTVLNALNHKRKQLPKQDPAVIYCLLPERWFTQGSNWNQTLETLAIRFLRGTRKINVLVFWIEQNLPRGDGEPGGVFGLVGLPYFHTNPRRPIDLTFMQEGMKTSEFYEKLDNGESLDALEREANSSEFFRWIDSLVPAPENT